MLIGFILVTLTEVKGGKTGLTGGGTMAWAGDPGLYQARKAN